MVEGRFYEGLSDELAKGAVAALNLAGASHQRVTVPGALEIPAAIRLAMAARGGTGFDGYVALGCVIRGETPHFDIVAHESARSLQQLSIDHGLAIGNGILTVENEAQAWARAKVADSGKGGDKGGDAARAALALIALRRRFLSDPA
jgi:6,7-dimethyl-8-ribityllumazine synthase